MNGEEREEQEKNIEMKKVSSDFFGEVIGLFEGNRDLKDKMLKNASTENIIEYNRIKSILEKENKVSYEWSDNYKDSKRRDKLNKHQQREGNDKNKKSTKDEEFSDNIHMEIHAVRRLSNYKASPMEVNISKFVIERFKDGCKECYNMGEIKKKNPKKKEGFIAKLGNLADQ